MKMRVFGDLVEYAGDGIVLVPAFERQLAADDVEGSKIFERDIAGDNDIIGLQEGRRLVAAEQRQGEDVEEIGIGKSDIFLKGHVLILDDLRAALLQTGSFFYLGVFLEKNLGNGGHDVRLFNFFFLYRGAKLDPHDLIRPVIIAVVAEFVMHKKHNDQAGGHADGEPGDIDGGKALIPPEIADSDLEIIFKHKYGFSAGLEGIVFLRYQVNARFVRH